MSPNFSDCQFMVWSTSSNPAFIMSELGGLAQLLTFCKAQLPHLRYLVNNCTSFVVFWGEVYDNAFKLINRVFDTEDLL